MKSWNGSRRKRRNSSPYCRLSKLKIIGFSQKKRGLKLPTKEKFNRKTKSRGNCKPCPSCIYQK